MSCIHKQWNYWYTLLHFEMLSVKATSFIWLKKSSVTARATHMCWIVIDRLHTCPGFKKIINKTLDGQCRQHFSPVTSNAQHPNTHRYILVKLHLRISFFFNSQYVHQVVLSPKNKLQVPPCGCGSTAPTTTHSPLPIFKSLKRITNIWHKSHSVISI